MRVYSVSSEEALRARNLLKDWAGAGLLTEAQYRRMEQGTVCELRRTTIFLRLVLFLFTLIIAGAAVGLFFELFLTRPAAQTTGIFLLIFGAVFYAAAEFAVSRDRLYRYGIEEALAACSVGFLCVGIESALFTARLYSPKPNPMEFLVPAAGAIASLWMWHRFGFAYAVLAAMIFVIGFPGYWTSSYSAQHLIVAALYAGGLIALVAIRRRYRDTYRNEEYSTAEALLWLGIYVAINLQVFSVIQPAQWLFGYRDTNDFPRTAFYWTTWVLIWCLPPAILARGLRRKDRFVLAAGAIASLLTLITNKPYLGWARQTWDPMILGALLIGIALFARRWLADGPGGIRHGFTAQRLSGKDRRWMNAGSVAFGLLSPHAVGTSPQSDSPGVHFGGGDSAGGGATSDF